MDNRPYNVFAATATSILRRYMKKTAFALLAGLLTLPVLLPVQNYLKPPFVTSPAIAAENSEGAPAAPIVIPVERLPRRERRFFGRSFAKPLPGPSFSPHLGESQNPGIDLYKRRSSGKVTRSGRSTGHFHLKTH